MRRLLIALIMILVLASSVSGAEKLLVFRFKGTGVGEDLIDAVTVLFNQAIDGEGKYRAVSAFEVVGDVECYDVDCASAYARQARISKAVTGNLTRLGSKIIVGVRLVDVGRNEAIVNVDATSLSEEDLDVVLRRLAIAVTSGREMEETAEVGLITESEYTDSRRRKAFSSGGLRVGFLWPTGGTMAGVDRMTVIDLAVQHDMRDYFLAGKSGVHWGKRSGKYESRAFGITLFEAKAGRYANRGDFSPFISAGLGITWTRIRETGPEGASSDSGAGFLFSVGTGFAAFRTYDFQFQLGIDYQVVFEKLNTGYSSAEYPQGILITFCIKRSRNKDDL